MTRIVVISAIAVGVLATGAPGLAQTQAQGTPTSAAPSNAATELSPIAAQVLGRTIAVRLNHVTLRDALAAIASQGQAQLTYSSQVVPLDRVISLTADAITVGAALARVLEGTALHVSVTPQGWIMLEPSQLPVRGSASLSGHDQQGTAALSGYVRDSATRAAIPQVTIRVNGTTLETKSSSDGQYTIAGLVAGEYKLTARRVGYIALTRTVTISDGDNKKLNFDLSPPATQLNEVVTTALGDQRRYQVGNIITTINVDSLAPTVPATNVTDLLEGRVPGMEVMESSGMVGSGQDIRIRGQGSLLLQTDPIIIVDGIRVDNSPGGSSIFFGGETSGPSRINDLDFTQIESINVLKGPSATTEYGTDAANGVIVITTKRGAAGRPQWHFSVDEAGESVPTGFQNYYYSWGHATDGSGVSAACPLSTASDIGLPSTASGLGNCVVDSLTAFNPLDHASTSVYGGSAPYSRYDANVSGGTETVRYYVAGGVNDAIGNTHVPDVFRSQAIAIGYPTSAFSPNSQNQRSASGTTSIRLTDAVDVQVSMRYTSTFQQAPGSEAFVSGLGVGPAIPDSQYNYGYGYAANQTGVGCGFYGLCSTLYSPIVSLGQDFHFSDERWTGNVTTNWSPIGWAHAALALGIDHGSLSEESETLPQAQNIIDPYDTASGALEIGSESNDIYTFDLRASATAHLIGRLRGTTALGAQYVQQTTNGVSGQASGLSVYNFSVTGGPNRGAQSVAQGVVTAGAYVEETFAYGDRLFIPVALRLDAGSGFGATSQFAGKYPKYGGSYLLLNGPTTIRVRGSYGAAGQQPPYGASLGLFSTQLNDFPGQQIGTGLLLNTIANNALKPETGTEIEAGLDFSTLQGRLNIGGTYYSNYRHNALWSPSLGFDLDNLAYTENIGDIRNTGTEFTLDAVLLRSRAVTWSVSFNTSLNTNVLLRLAPGVLSTQTNGNEYFVAGYPLYSYWARDARLITAPASGIVQANEVAVDTGMSYVGPSLPRQETSVSTHVALFRGMVSLDALFDAKSLFLVDNGASDPVTNGGNESTQLTDADLNIPTAPQWEQLRDLANFVAYPTCCSNTTSPEFLDGAFIRWRELSVAYTLPRSWLRSSPLKMASLVAKLRNIYLWTRYPFGDPEVSNGVTGNSNSVSNAATVTNDIRSTNNSVTPLPRFFDLGLNLAF